MRVYLPLTLLIEKSCYLLWQHVLELMENWRPLVQAINDNDIDESRIQDAINVMNILHHIDEHVVILKAVAKIIPEASTVQANQLIMKFLEWPGTIHFDFLDEALRQGRTSIDASVALVVCRRLAHYCSLSALWRILHSILPNLEPSSLPFLQHWAYSNIPSSIEHQELQSKLAARLNSMNLDPCENLISMARCLLHTSQYIRRSASVGLLSSLVDDETFPEQRDWVLHVNSTDNDPFENIEEAILQHTMQFKLPHKTNLPKKNLSSVISSFQKYNTILSSATLEWKIKETVIEQAMEAFGNPCEEVITGLIASGELWNLTNCIFSLLADSDVKHHFIPLLLLRDIVISVPKARDIIRNNHYMLHCVMPFIFAENLDLRACSYIIVLFLTCSSEVWGKLEGNKIPSMIQSTFGLHSKHWSKFGVRSYDFPINNPDFDGPPITQARQLNCNIPADYISEAISRVNNAASHREYLNNIFRLIWLSQLDLPLVGAEISMQLHTKSSFLRFLHTAPSSWRDEIALVSVFDLLTVVIPTLELSDLIYIMLAVKSLSNSLLKGLSKSQGGRLERKVLNVLLALSERQGMAEYVSAFLLEEQLHETLHMQYVNGSDHVSQALVLHLVQNLVSKDSSLAHWFSHELFDSLVQVVGEYRSSDSFKDKNIISQALKTLVLIFNHFSSVPKAEVPTRFIFDRDSRIRALGYASLPANDKNLIDVAKDTLLNRSECAAVRIKAARYLMHLSSVEPEYILKLQTIFQDNFLTPGLILACLNLFLRFSRKEIEVGKFAPIEFHKNLQREICRQATGLKTSEKDDSKASSTFQNIWDHAHRISAMECSRRIFSIQKTNDKFDVRLIRALNDIFSLDCDLSIVAYAELLGAGLEYLGRMMNKCTLDDLGCETLVKKIKIMVDSDETIVPACHFLHLISQHKTWNSLLGNDVGITICDQLLTNVIKSISTQTLPHIAWALQSILECNAAFVALAIERKFIEHCLDRLVGHLANQVDELVLYLRLLKAILCNNNDAQLKAMELHLPNRFASMWPHISNPVVLKEWLEVLCNFTFNNLTTKQALIGSNNQTSCFQNILKHASSLKQHSSLAFTVLKSIVLSGDCVQATIRYGYVSKFMGLLASQLYKRRRGKAQAPIIPYVLDVLVNISFSAEGRAEICQNESLRDILQDLFDTPGLERLATLFCRNLSFATIAKTQLAQWKAVMQTLLSLLAHDDKFICNYASTAIWSILYNNQRVTSSVLTELNSFAKIQQAREFYTQALNSSSLHESDQILLQEALENLEHIQKLIQHSNDNAKDARMSMTSISLGI
ncbi:hypothetical protein Ae201684_017247 [Aphanomyces euteiches]|uniref:Uncharacterized protein n=1 Tax=Aphanomyces euteiches TaxID=100861 RepID=A0A6G0WA20_9STRA|nr:hypothetical protein Ae201684_017247 [Aphanomyces euteiches]